MKAYKQKTIILIFLITIAFFGFSFQAEASKSNNYRIIDDSLGIEDRNDFGAKSFVLNNSKFLANVSDSSFTAKTAASIFSLFFIFLAGFFILKDMKKSKKQENKNADI